MHKRLTSLVLLAGLGLLSACETTAAGGKTADTAAKSKLADVETLQKATALANGNMAWETVDISQVQRDAEKVTWLAKTRSLHLHCTAEPDGSGSYCAPLPDSPGV
ncbi:MAG: hypothetical protein JWO72_1499 [Caulobacteraceae bacterium]|nr:hypothetical protein [Caulobacteraceae bacterium]